MGERLSAAFIGLFIGAFVGLALAWIFGVYSNRLGPAVVVLDFKRIVLYSALGFAAVGLLFGHAVLTLLGGALGLLFRLEDTRDEQPDLGWPTCWVVAFLVAVVALAIWWFA